MLPMMKRTILTQDDPEPTKSSKIWNYGARLVGEHAEVSKQLFLAHRYYNTLIEIEHKRRAEYRIARDSVAAIEPVNAEYADVTQRLEQARGEIKSARQQQRKRLECTELRKQVLALLDERRVIVAKRKQQRLLLKTDAWLLRRAEEINAAASGAVRQARGDCGVYWGTYLLIEKAYQAACKSKGAGPKFRAWRGQGRVGVQIQGGMTIDEVLSDQDPRLRIKSLPPETWNTRNPRHRGYTEVLLRIGSDIKGRPIWATCSAQMHRPLPPGCVIKWCWLKVFKVGTRVQYALQLTVQSEQPHNRILGDGAASMDLGWRMMPTGNIRVGYLVDEYGKTRSYEMPHPILRALEYTQRLRGIADQLFNVARAHFSTWLKGNPTIPEWLQGITQHLLKWRSPARLAIVSGRWSRELVGDERLLALAKEWRLERLRRGADQLAPFEEIIAWLTEHGVKSEDERVAMYMEIWRRKNAHLYDWECAQRRKAQQARKYLYRNWARELSKSYDTIVLEDFDLRRFARKALPEETEEQTNRMRFLARSAAPAEFRMAIVEAMGKAAVKTDPAFTTQDCSQCGAENEIDDTRPLMLPPCPNCGIRIDQDENAARNLLSRFCEGSGGDPAPGGARSPEKVRESRDREPA